MGLTRRANLALRQNNVMLTAADIQGAGKSLKFVAEVDFRQGEFAGATFDPSGRWLFVNTQNPGVTYAITGPWERGLL